MTHPLVKQGYSVSDGVNKIKPSTGLILFKKSHDPEGERSLNFINPLSHMPTYGSYNSAANKDMMSKIWTNEDKII